MTGPGASSWADGNGVSLALDVAGLGAGFLPGGGLVTGSARAANIAFGAQVGFTVASTGVSAAYKSGPGIVLGILGGQMNEGNIKTREPEARTDELRKLIRSAFPAHIYDGVITAYDDKLEDPELDEEKELYERLKGKTWTDVPQRFLDSRPDGYVLLVDKAFVAFIAAWLTRSLDDIDGENKVRDFVVYAFAPKRDLVPDTTGFIRQRLIALDGQQRDTLHALLMEFAETEPSAFQRKLASEAVGLIDSLS